MDFTERMAQVRRYVAESAALLQEARLVACLGSRMALSLLTSAVEPGRQLVAATTAADEALQRLTQMEGNVLFCSDALERGSGIELVLAAKGLPRTVRTLLVVTQPQRTAGIRRAIAAGCDGLCLESRIGMGTVLQAIATVGNGGIYLEQALSEQYLAVLPGMNGGITPLTERERDVLALVTAGFSNTAIGAKLYIGPETVKSHMSRIRRKLQARDRTHAAVQGIRLGLVDWPEPG